MDTTHGESDKRWQKPQLIELPRIYDPRGNLTFVQDGDGILPFDIKRVYWVYDVPAGEQRGAHAHRNLREFIIATAGSFTVRLSDGVDTLSFTLNRPFIGLYVPPGYWRTLDNFSSGSVCMVIVSAQYDEADYIRAHDEFLRSKGCSDEVPIP